MDKRVLTGGIWTAVEAAFRFGVQFGVSVVLARILSPTDFGVYALTAIFIALSGVLVDSGFSSALIQKQDTDRREESAVFCYNVLIAGVLALAIAAVAPLVARAYGHPVLRPLLYASAAILFVNSLGAVPGAMLAKRMQFATMARLSVTMSLIGAGAGVAAALLGAGIWTFPIQAGVTGALGVASVWVISGWRPLRGFDLRPARRLAQFGSLLAVSALLEVAYSNGYPLILGRLYGATDVGFYNRGQSIQALPANMITGVVQKMLFPILSSQVGDPAAMKRSTRTGINWAMAVNTPALMFLAFFPDLVITVVFGAKWLPAAPVLTILAAGGILFPLHVVNLQVVLAQGKSGLFLRLEIVKKVLGVTLVAAGCFFGIAGLALSQLAFLVLAFFINSRPSSRLIGYSSFEQIRDVAPICALSFAVMAALRVAEPLMGGGDVVRLATLLAIAGAAYGAAAFLLRVGPVHELVGGVRSRLATAR